FVEAAILGFSFAVALRHAILYVVSDNRHFRTALVALLPYLVFLVLLNRHFPFGDAEWVLAILLPATFLSPLVFFIFVFDAPLERNFGASASEMFRYYLDHLTTGSIRGEEIIERFADRIQAQVGVLAFRKKDGSVKAVMAVPAVHPGPIGALGGSDLPSKIASEVKVCRFVLVPHGAATHDFNPVSTREVERLGLAVRQALDKVVWEAGGSEAVRVEGDLTVTAQYFGTGALLTYTSWPEALDDVDFGVGRAGTLSARIGGARDAIFIDCHNSLKPAAGAVYPCTPRALRIEALCLEASRKAAERRGDEMAVGVAADRDTFGRDELIGAQGLQVVATRILGKTHAYALWDGNNMLPECTRVVQDRCKDLVDSFVVMTTDNHSVNAVAGGFSPIGRRVSHERVAEATRKTLEEALSDIEPVDVALETVSVDDFRVFGHHKTAMLTGAINVMTNLLGKLVIATVIVQFLAAAIVFLVARQAGA
ncbi:MAG: DUF2070 family protein, partial [Methanobacteriota archaeon]